MSQSGYTPIITYNSGTTTNVPVAGNLANGELALNYADGKLFYKDSGGVVQVLASKSGNVNVSSFSAGTTGLTPNTATTGAVTLSGTLGTTNGGTGLTSFTANGVVYASSTSALATGSALTFNGSNLQVVSATNPTSFLSVDSGLSTHSMYAQFNTSSNIGIIGTYTSDPLAFFTGNTEKMRLTSAGNLGIGTSSPSTYLQVGNGSGSSQNYIWAAGNSTNPPSAATYGVLLGTNLSQSNSEANLVWGQGISSSQYFAIGKWTGSAYSEQMRLDSSGNLGLGVTPSAWDSTFKNIQIGGNGYSGSFYSQANGDTSNGIVLNAYYSSGWKYTASSKASTQYEQNNGIHKWSVASSGTAGNAISFTQAMTLDNSGNLLINTTTRKSFEKVSVTVDGSAQEALVLNDTSSSGIHNAISLYRPGGYIGGLQTTSTSTSLITSSDQRLKTNIVDAPDGNIDGIKVRSFNWLVDGSHQEYGMIAQELLEVAPYAVYQPENPDEMMGVDYSKLVPMMIKEIQSFKQRIATLESK